MDITKQDKIDRVLGIYTRLINGYVVKKAELAVEYGVNERSIQRDIDDIRNYLGDEASRSGYINYVIYDRQEKGYKLERTFLPTLANSEVLAICKILLESRAFRKDEMYSMIEKMIACCVPKANQKLVSELVANEAFHYVEPQHRSSFMDTMWNIGQAIKECRYIELDYARLKGSKIVTRKVKPVAIMFSEYYFYLTAFIDDDEVQQHFDVINDSSPTIYRIDRIQNMRVLDEHFRIPYADRFEEGEFRKRVQFMYGGKLKRVKFEFSGASVEAVLDRLPTAKILAEEDGVYTISAEVFGSGIDMWVRSQGDSIRLLEEENSR